MVRRFLILSLCLLAVARAAAPAHADVRVDYDLAKQLGTIAGWDAFLAHHPTGYLADLARTERQKLEGQQQALLNTPPPKPPAPYGGLVLALSGSRAAAPLSANEEGALKPKDTFQECVNCPAMVVIPPGTFTMGSPESEPERLDSEGPQHDVTIARSFAVGKFTVTFDEWDACVADGGCNGYRPYDFGWGRGRRPVINVSWNEAQAYAAWLSRKTGKDYRLLSESEWEYAARAGTTTPFYWGSTITPDQANYDGTEPYNGGPTGVYRQKTVPVGSFQANPFGLYNMAGNVWQWVEDCWHENYNGAPRDVSAWTTGDCSRRVLRGGSWFNNPGDLRAANRYRSNPVGRHHDVGLRLARTLNP